MNLETKASTEAYKSTRPELNPIAQGLLRNAKVEPHGAGFDPKRITNALFEKDRVLITLQYSGSELETKFAQTRNVDIYPISLEGISYDSKGKNYLFDFKLNEGFDLAFVSEEGFHNLTRHLIAFGYGTAEKQFETTGLEPPDSVEGELAFRLPFKIWHALPKELFSHVSGFRFQRGNLAVTWPYQEEHYTSTKDTDRLIVTPYDMINDVRKSLVNKLRSNMLVRQELSDSPRNPSVQDEKLLLSKEVNYDLLIRFENSISDIELDSYRDDDVEITFSGELPSKVIAGIHGIYENFFSGQLKTDYMTIHKPKFGSTATVSITEGDLITAGRISDLLPSHLDAQFVAFSKGQFERGHSPTQIFREK